MMAKLCVSSSDACLSIPQLLLPPQLPNPRCMRTSSISAETSRLRAPKRRIGGTEERSSGFNFMATVGWNVESLVIPTSVPVRVANELLLAGHRFLDVRTPEEFSVGHAVGAINVPYMFKVGSGMANNLNFMDDVLSQFGKDDEIIVGCQSGKRSQMAAVELISAGFTGITHISGGYGAWTQNGLPMED